MLCLKSLDTAIPCCTRIRASPACAFAGILSLNTAIVPLESEFWPPARMHRNVWTSAVFCFTEQFRDLPASCAVEPARILSLIRLNWAIGIIVSHCNAEGPLPAGDSRESSIVTRSPRDAEADESRKVWPHNARPKSRSAPPSQTALRQCRILGDLEKNCFRNPLDRIKSHGFNIFSLQDLWPGTCLSGTAL